MAQPIRPEPLIIRPKPHRNWLKVVFVCIILFFTVFTGAGVGFSVYYGNSIQERILAELNKKLNTKVWVRGPVHFSVFSNFPNASLQINDIVVMGSTGLPTDTLLKAGKLSLLMNIFDVINREWEIKSIVIQDGWLNMQRRGDGVINYDITKTSAGNSKDTASIFVHIHEAVLKNINYHYNDKISQADLNLALDEASLEGNFSSSQLDIKTEATLIVNSALLKGIDYGKQKHVSLAGSFQAAPAKNSYTVKSDNIIIEDNHFSLNGTVSSQGEETNMDFKVKGIDLSINGLLKMFPQQYSKQWTDYNASGNLQFDVAVKGVLSKTKNPLVNINYKVNKTQLHSAKLAKDIRSVSFDGSYTNGSQQNLETSEINVKSLNGFMGDKPIYVQFDVKNLSNPTIKLEVDGYISLDFFDKIIPDSIKLHDLRGGVMISGLSYNGRLADLTPTTDKIPEIRGNLTFQDLHLRWDTTKLEIPSGVLKIVPSGIAFDNLQVKLANSDFTLQGSVQDWKGYASNLLDPALPKAKPMDINLTASADRLILENFVNLGAEPNHKQPTASKKTTSLNDVMNINGSLEVKTKVIGYKKFQATELTGRVTFTPGHADLKELAMKTMKGKFSMTSNLAVTGNNTEILCSFHGADMDVSELFYEMNNFGQHELTDKNLKGKLNTSTQVNLYFTNGNIDLSKLYVKTDIRIDDGELVSYPALKSLSKFIKISELEDVKFSTLQNQVEIKNQTINIPRMIVKTSALNLSLAGSHTFNNVIDYRIKLNAYDVIANKLRKHKLAKDDYEVLDDNSFNFFISMKGPADNPEVKFDKKAVVERFKQQAAEIKANLKGTKEKYNTDKEKHDWNTKDTVEFIDWEEKK